MTNEKRLAALAELQAEGKILDLVPTPVTEQEAGDYLDEGLDMTNDSEFDLEKESWDEAKKFKSLVDCGLTCCGSDLYKAGFSKALDLVMEEASKQFYKIGDAGVPVLTSRQLERIISKLRGEKPSKLCPCHNLPCVWTSYNPELWNEPKKDHYSCSVTKEKVE